MSELAKAKTQDPFIANTVRAGRASRLPPLRTVQAALRTTTELLAEELARPTAQAPAWSEFEWRIARAAAALHGVSPLLKTRLQWSGPRGWAEFLQAQNMHTEKRQLQIAALLSDLNEQARRAGIGFLALKGAALHAMGLYRPGERPMADLDLLGRPADAPQLAHLVAQAGFRESAVTWKHYLFEPLHIPPAGTFGEESANALKIDLHLQIAEILPRRTVEISRLLIPARLDAGLNAYATPAALMLHLLLHAAGAIVFRTLRLIQLHDLALLGARLSSADWDALLDLGRTAGGMWWALSPLMLTQRYYGNIPERVLETVARSCPRRLRTACREQRLTEVSYSDLRRSAFPGIEWTRSRGDELAYVATRTVLSMATLLRTLSTGRSSIKPGNASFQETRSRAVPFLAWYPARPATLNAVRAALAQPY